MAKPLVFEPFFSRYAAIAIEVSEKNAFHGVFADEWFDQCMRQWEKDEDSNRPAEHPTWKTFQHYVSSRQREPWFTPFSSLGPRRGYCLKTNYLWCKQLIDLLTDVKDESCLYEPLREWLETVQPGTQCFGFIASNDKEGAGRNPDVIGYHRPEEKNSAVDDIVCIDAKAGLSNWPIETGPVLTYYRFSNRAYIAYPVLTDDESKILPGFPKAMVVHLARNGVGLLAVMFKDLENRNKGIGRVVEVLPAVSQAMQSQSRQRMFYKCWNADEECDIRLAIRTVARKKQPFDSSLFRKEAAGKGLDLTGWSNHRCESYLEECKRYMELTGELV